MQLERLTLSTHSGSGWSQVGLGVWGQGWCSVLRQPQRPAMAVGVVPGFL